MEPKTFKSERDTQIVTNRKVTIRKGDEITVTYFKNDLGKTTGSQVDLNGESLGKYDLEELEEFLQIFFSDSF